MSTRCDEFGCNNAINTSRVQNSSGLPIVLHDFSNSIEVRVVVTAHKDLCIYCEDKYIMKSLKELQVVIQRVLREVNSNGS